ncbi:MAG: SMI1/KNR4 family protein [Planctomycetes bacterium]|nr:SMI1/KNR4 family protein [Planctomycetota bacterium]
MNPINHPEHLKSLLDRVFELRRQYYELDTQLKQTLGPPASEADIRDFEEAIGFTLPPSYRAFLSLHDGWIRWEGDIHILSLAQMREGPFVEWVREWKKEAEESEDVVVLNGLIIATQLHWDTGLILDTNEVDDQGEMPIVNWDRSEIVRYTSFSDLLERSAEDLQGLIDNGV